jgi:hypothetical protein
MKKLTEKLFSPLAIAWGRTPVAYKWGEPDDDFDFLLAHVARRYHPHWHSGKFLLISNLLYFFMLAAWPIRATIIIFNQTHRHATAAKSRFEVGRLKQVADQCRIAFLHWRNPEIYYLYELFDPCSLAKAPHFLMNNEIFALVGILNNYESNEAVEDKLGFNAQLRSEGFPVIADLALVTGNSIEFSDPGAASLPSGDFIAKPRRGLQGKRFACFEHTKEGTYRSDQGRTIEDTELVAELQGLAATGDLLIQPRLRNHRELQDLSVNGFATARVLTALDTGNQGHVIQAVFKLPTGDAYADNYAIGSIASPVQLDDGTLGPATAEDVLAPTYDVHPTTGATICGRTLPAWREAKRLLTTAHELFPQYRLLAWDIGFTDEGPVIVEANRDMGMELLQKPGQRPLGLSHLPEICRQHLHA